MLQQKKNWFIPLFARTADAVAPHALALRRRRICMLRDGLERALRSVDTGGPRNSAALDISGSATGGGFPDMLDGRPRCPVVQAHGEAAEIYLGLGD